MSVLGQSTNVLSSILTILLTCPNNNTLLCYSNDPFLTVYEFITLGQDWAGGNLMPSPVGRQTRDSGENPSWEATGGT